MGLELHSILKSTMFRAVDKESPKRSSDQMKTEASGVKDTKTMNASGVHSKRKRKQMKILGETKNTAPATALQKLMKSKTVEQITGALIVLNAMLIGVQVQIVSLEFRNGSSNPLL